MCAADSAAENFYENAHVANADYENVFLNRSPVRGILHLHVEADGMEQLQNLITSELDHLYPIVNKHSVQKESSTFVFFLNFLRN